MLKPSDHGFDKQKFPAYRQCQNDIIDFILSSQKSKVVISAPTGSGKSLTYMAAIKRGKMGRTLILTSTKGLQDQIVKDFGNMLFNISGKNNYKCEDRGNLITCDIAPCNFGYDCDLKELGCSYFDSLRQARDSEVVLTNYHYYLAMSDSGVPLEKGLGQFNTVICDEGHELPNILANHLTVELSKAKFFDIFGEDLQDLGSNTIDWVSYIKERHSEVKDELRTFKDSLSNKFSTTLAKEIAKREDLSRKFQRIIDMSDGDGYGNFVEYAEDYVKFGPVKFFTNWAEWEFFGMFKKALIFSATVREKTMKMLGVPKEEFDFMDTPSVFDANLSPKIHIKSLSVNRKVSDFDLKTMWIPKIDQILKDRLDRKGIIHVSSYRYANLIYDHSKYRSKMFFPKNAREKRRVVSAFKDAETGILIGPALHTGYDFPGDQCVYQIITKVPYPNLGDKFLMERVKYDGFLIAYMVSQALVQSTGRGTRKESDICENFIVDDSILSFIQRFSSFFPKWWLDSYVSKSTIPDPISLR